MEKPILKERKINKKSHITHRTSQNSGITLVALIITIIVLLILAVVAIRAVQGDGIISKAKDAAKQTNIAQEKEELQMAVLEWQLVNKNGVTTLSNFLSEKYGEDNVQLNADKSITVTMPSENRYKVTSSGEAILLDGTVEEPEPIVISITLDKTSITKEITSGSTGTETLTATLNNASGELTWKSSDTSVADISGSGNTRTITLKKAGTATITVSYGTANEKCSVTVTEKAGNVAYTIGQKVLVRNALANKDETFYVIKDSDATQDKVTLLAKDCIDTTNLLQSSSAGKVAFSTESYWGTETSPYDIAEPDTIPATHIAAKAAYDYGVEVGGTGRLMNYREAEALQSANTSDILYGTNGKSSSSNLNYWLGSAFGTEYVWIVNGTDSRLSYRYVYDYVYGARPVVEISKSLVSSVVE